MDRNQPKALKPTTAHRKQQEWKGGGQKKGLLSARIHGTTQRRAFLWQGKGLIIKIFI